MEPQTPPRGKLTDECEERLLTALREGNYLSVAARHAGVSPSTVRKWLERGRRESIGRHRLFYERYQEASAEAEVRAVAVLHREIDGNWRAAAEFLSRRFPRRWSRRPGTEASSRGPEPAPLNLENVYDDRRLARILEILCDVGAFPAGPPSLSASHDEPVHPSDSDG